MGTIAAIDIGSNAIRLILGQLDSHGEIKIVRKVREPVRLGADVFSKGELSKATRAKAIEAFQKFRAILTDAGVQHFKAVATSAMREAADRLTRLAQQRHRVPTLMSYARAGEVSVGMCDTAARVSTPDNEQAIADIVRTATPCSTAGPSPCRRSTRR